MGDDRVDSDHELFVYGSSIKEEGTNDSLGALDAIVVKWKTSVGFSGIILVCFLYGKSWHFLGLG